MEWLLNRNGVSTMKIWPFEAVGALMIIAIAKVWRLGGLPKRSVFRWFSSTTNPMKHLIL